MKTTSSIRFKNELLNTESGIVMGVLNLTPDSFYKGSRFPDLQFAVAQIEKMIHEGMDILDIGAFSSRPGAKLISEEEEWSRLVPVLTEVKKSFPGILVSLDTYRSGIAKKAVLDYGVGMINDISAGRLDNKMPKTVAELQVPVV